MCNYEESELTAARRHMKELQTAVAAQQSKIACLETFEKEKKEQNKLLKRRPREGFCIFDEEGLPLMWTVRMRERDAIRKFEEYKGVTSFNWYVSKGWSVGPCVVKPIIKVEN